MGRAIACFAGLAIMGLTTFAWANPNKDYLVSAKEGPWMIYVASYSGDENHDNPTLRPKEMARRLVNELRTDYKLPAFMFNRSEEKRRQQEKELEKWHRQYDAANARAPGKKVRIPDEWAVLVGNYRDFEEAAKAAAKLKKQPPPKSVQGSLAVMSTKMTKTKSDLQAAEMNTFAGAFPCRNPLAPKPPEEEEKFDPFLTTLNAGEPYNLLKTRKPWTLMVKVYQGATVVVPEKKPSVFSMRNNKESVVDRQFRLFNKSKGQDLANAAEMAHNLAKVLRHKDLGYESFVLHTRSSSIVTVGSFSGPKDPELLKLAGELAGKKIGAVDLISQPVAMKVPQS